MRCEEIQELIPAYMNHELDVVRNAAVKTHVRACEACRGAHEQHSNLHWLIRTSVQYFKAPDGLKSRIKKRISEV